MALGDSTKGAAAVKDYRVPQMMRLAHLEVHVTRASLGLRHMMLGRDAAERKAALDEILERKRRADETMKAVEEGALTPVGRTEAARIRAVYDAFWEVGVANLKLVVDGRYAEGFAMLVERTVGLRNRLVDAVYAERKRQDAMIEQEMDALAAREGTTRNLIVVRRCADRAAGGLRRLDAAAGDPAAGHGPRRTAALHGCGRRG